MTIPAVQIEQDQLAEAAQSKLPSLTHLELVSASQNVVYRATHGWTPVIVRCTPPNWRTPSDIAFELEFLDHLAGGGLSVARAVPVGEDRLHQVRVADACWTTVVFGVAPGVPLSRAGFDATRLEQVGEYLGAMHAASIPFATRAPQERDIHAADDALLRQYLDTDLLRRHDEITARLRQAPREHTSYGLTHADVHSGNVFVAGQSVRLIDFDNLRLGWRVGDLLNLMYEINLRHPESACEMESALLTGYGRPGGLDAPSTELAALLIRDDDLSEVVSIRHRGNPAELDSKRYHALLDSIGREEPSFLPRWSLA